MYKTGWAKFYYKIDYSDILQINQIAPKLFQVKTFNQDSSFQCLHLEWNENTLGLAWNYSKISQEEVCKIIEDYFDERQTRYWEDIREHNELREAENKRKEDLRKRNISFIKRCTLFLFILFVLFLIVSL